ncbi:putative Glycosyl transferase group 1 [Nitrospira japonica]|uniref:Putative Glycosyl transferase group 1 n=2 Tax=Nitrospira japonica TaxID=1325564 RepID=A0A1W1I9Q0_9BACT|nr:putative Glycosyl transferase group 1 [Nitrospira japonica]
MNGNSNCEATIASERGSDPCRSAARVLYLVNLNPSMKFGSLEEQIFLLSEGLSNRGGLLVPVFSRDPNESHGMRYRKAGLPVASLRLGRFRASALARLLRLADDHRVQVIHWNLYPPINPYVPLLKLLRPKIRHILTDHNSRPRSFVRSTNVLKRLSHKWFASAYSDVFAVSNYVHSDLLNQKVWKNPRRYYHFVNTDRFKPDVETKKVVRASLGCERRFVMLVVAHLIPEKGVDAALRALALLPSHVSLWIVGDGPEREKLEQLVESLGVGERTTFLGLCADVCRYMQAADCLICPSLWEEAAGLVILEAMASGLPVIASYVGGIPEFVRSGQNGFLVAAGDYSAVARHVAALAECRPLLNEIALAARGDAVARFSHETRVPQALSLYDTQTSDAGKVEHGT